MTNKNNIEERRLQNTNSLRPISVHWLAQFFLSWSEINWGYSKGWVSDESIRRFAFDKYGFNEAEDTNVLELISNYNISHNDVKDILQKLSGKQKEDNLICRWSIVALIWLLEEWDKLEFASAVFEDLVQYFDECHLVHELSGPLTGRTSYIEGLPEYYGVIYGEINFKNLLTDWVKKYSHIVLL